MKTHCPTCQAELKITIVPTVAPEGPARRSATDITPLTDKTLADVFEFMRFTGEATRTTAVLYADYLAWTDLPRPLSKNAFARALSANGATRWRDSQNRGFTIPAIAEQRPATMTPAARERFEAAHQRRGVEDHRGGGRPVEAGLDDEGRKRLEAGLPPF